MQHAIMVISETPAAIYAVIFMGVLLVVLGFSTKELQ